MYSSVEFLLQVQDKPISYQDFKKSFAMYGVASASSVLQLSQECGWVVLDDEGYLSLTSQGIAILNEPSDVCRLRAQLLNMISFYQPIWAKKIPSGRAEARGAFPEDAKQCFSEAGLLDSWNDELIEWWDKLAQTTKAKKYNELLQIGRDAERRSVNFELARTGQHPTWQSLESNYSGFDVLSRVSSSNDTPLKIEVKGSTLSIKQAYFTLTRNEWNTAENSLYYCLHLWSLSANPVSVRVVDKDLLRPHLPHNQGDGKWENVRIPFAPFKETAVNGSTT